MLLLCFHRVAHPPKQWALPACLRQSRYLHFGIQAQQLHAKLPGPCVHLIYHCTAGILETLAKIIASFLRGFMFRVKHFVIIQTIKNHVAFPNPEGLKNHWIVFHAFFLCLRPGVLCPTLLTQPAWLAVPIKPEGKQSYTNERAFAGSASVVWTTSAAIRGLSLRCCEGGSAAQTRSSADPACLWLLSPSLTCRRLKI